MACSCPRIFGHDWMGTRPHIVEPTFIAGFGRLVIGLEHWMEVKSCSAKYCSLISQECPNEAFIPWRAGPCANSYDFTPSGITRMSRRQICNARFGVWIYLRPQECDLRDVQPEDIGVEKCDGWLTIQNLWIWRPTMECPKRRLGNG